MHGLLSTVVQSKTIAVLYTFSTLHNRIAHTNSEKIAGNVERALVVGGFLQKLSASNMENVRACHWARVEVGSRAFSNCGIPNQRTTL